MFLTHLTLLCPCDFITYVVSTSQGMVSFGYYFFDPLLLAVLVAFSTYVLDLISIRFFSSTVLHSTGRAFEQL